MVHSKPDATAIIKDPAWLAHRFDAESDTIEFVHADRSAHDSATFLTDENLPGVKDPRISPRAEVLPRIAAPAPVHFIFHSAYCCSTLLARAFDMPDASFALKEPQLLNDISGWKRRGARPEHVADALQWSLALLAKPFQPGEQIVIKPSNVINGLAPLMLQTLPRASALFLYTPLPNYLASIARKGMWGRLWVRELFVKLSKDGLTDYGFSAEEIMQQTDLQIAAIGWLAQHRLFAAMIGHFGAGRIVTLQSEALLAEPAQSMTILAQRFGLEIAPDKIDAQVASVFGRHSKTGESFGRDARAGEHKAGLQTHEEEVEKVVHWAEAVAKAGGQQMILPAPLF